MVFGWMRQRTLCGHGTESLNSVIVVVLEVFGLNRCFDHSSFLVWRGRSFSLDEHLFVELMKPCHVTSYCYIPRIPTTIDLMVFSKQPLFY